MAEQQAPTLARVQVPGQGIRIKTSSGERSVPKLGRNGLPVCPYEIRDAIEMYGRKNNRSASVHFVPGGGWFARFSLRPNDPRMVLFQQGKAAEPPTEDVWFHVPDPNGRTGDYSPLDICEMGPQGVMEFLDRGNTWSGRGEALSPMDALRQNLETKEERRVQLRQRMKEENRFQQRERRRSLLKIPVLGWTRARDGKGA